MKKVTVLTAIVLTATVCLGVPCFGADNTAPAPDNTKMNKQQEVTAEQQGENKADLKITQQIRRAIMKNKSLSQYAHNVKIVTRNGAVTLQGPVRSEKERKTIEKAAKQVAGQDNVTSNLEVAPSKKAE